MWEQHWNTAEAFEAAAQDERCWGISADVRITADGQFVCFHDSTVNASTDGTGRIEDMTLAEVQALNVTRGIWNGSAWVTGPSAKIPLLTDFLDICRKHGKIALIETKAAGSADIKDLSNEALEAIMGYISARGMNDSVGFIVPAASRSFLYHNHPEVYRLALYTSAITVSAVSERLYDPNLVYVAYAYDDSLVPDSVIDFIHRNGSFIFWMHNKGRRGSFAL